MCCWMCCLLIHCFIVPENASSPDITCALSSHTLHCTWVGVKLHMWCTRQNVYSLLKLLKRVNRLKMNCWLVWPSHDIFSNQTNHHSNDVYYWPVTFAFISCSWDSLHWTSFWRPATSPSLDSSCRLRSSISILLACSCIHIVCTGNTERPADLHAVMIALNNSLMCYMQPKCTLTIALWSPVQWFKHTYNVHVPAVA